MTDKIPSLWSDDISTDVVSPLAILRSQAGMLRRLTKGLVEAEVSTSTGVTADEAKSAFTIHHLELIAIALGRSRHRIISVTHGMEMVYPVQVIAELYKESNYRDQHWPEAHTEADFIKLLEDALRSGPVKTILHSLIARSNENREPSDPPPDHAPAQVQTPAQKRGKQSN